MNEFKVKYIKLGIDYFVDFLSTENKNILVLDKDQTVILDVFQVSPENKYKFFEWIQKSKIRWIYPASWSGYPSDTVLTEDVYKFGIVESLNEDIYRNTNIIPGFTLPDSYIVNQDGNVISIPGETIPSTDIKTIKTFAEMYAEATLQGVFFGEIYLPEYYVGLASPGGDLFV
jgi:hypothetical protein